MFNESLNGLAPDSVVRRFGLGLAFAMGLNLSLSRLGSVFNNLISPAVALHFAHGHEDDEVLASAGSGSGPDSAASAGAGVPYALAFGCLVMGAATVASIVVFIIDAGAERAGRQAGYGDGATSVRAKSEAQERLLPESEKDGDASEEINLSAVFRSTRRSGCSRFRASPCTPVCCPGTTSRRRFCSRSTSARRTV